MPLIALTGGIATGKSTVARQLAKYGAIVVDSDSIAREIAAPGTNAFTEIVQAFGPDVVAADGNLDRERLGALVFADPPRRHLLEAITHPPIRSRTAARIQEALAASPPLVVVDIPLLFESKQEGAFPGLLVVYTDARTQRRRLRKRDNLDAQAAEARLAAQLSIETKKAHATWVIDNSSTPERTATQVDRWWQQNVLGKSAKPPAHHRNDRSATRGSASDAAE